MNNQVYTEVSVSYDIPILDTLLVRNNTFKMDIRRHLMRDLGWWNEMKNIRQT